MRVVGVMVLPTLQDPALNDFYDQDEQSDILVASSDVVAIFLGESTNLADVEISTIYYTRGYTRLEVRALLRWPRRP